MCKFGKFENRKSRTLVVGALSSALRLGKSIEVILGGGLRGWIARVLEKRRWNSTVFGRRSESRLSQRKELGSLFGGVCRQGLFGHQLGDPSFSSKGCQLFCKVQTRQFYFGPRRNKWVEHAEFC